MQDCDILGDCQRKILQAAGRGIETTSSSPLEAQRFCSLLSLPDGAEFRNGQQDLLVHLPTWGSFVLFNGLQS
jgi:hypothetical protein